MNKLQKVKEALELAEQVFNDMDALSWSDESEWQHSSYDGASQANMEALTELNEFMEGGRYYLTQEEVNNLPVGTRIIVHWSGGNNNCQYDIEGHREDGTAFINNIYKNNLKFVGIDPPKTQVRLAQAAINVIKDK